MVCPVNGHFCPMKNLASLRVLSTGKSITFDMMIRMFGEWHGRESNPSFSLENAPRMPLFASE